MNVPWVALVIRISAGIGARYRDEVEIGGYFSTDQGIREGLEHVLRDQRNPIPPLNLDDAVHTARSSQRGIVCAVAGAGHGFRALVGSPQKCIVPAECDAINPAAQVNFSSLAQGRPKFLQ
jgi:hypothetical protein